MSLKSVMRRSAIATVAVGSALALTACSAGQVTQTSDQVAAVDGAKNSKDGIPSGVGIRDAHIIIYPESDYAALKFTAVNQERADVTYTIDSIDVEGVGDVEFSPFAATEAAEARSQAGGSFDPLSFGRDCVIVADADVALEPIAESADQDQSCISYVATELDPETLTGENNNAAGLSRNVTFSISGSDGSNEEITLYATVSAYIPEPGDPYRVNGQPDHEAHQPGTVSGSGANADGDVDEDGMTGETGTTTQPLTTVQ